jgi:hypothetical protein
MKAFARDFSMTWLTAGGLGAAALMLAAPGLAHADASCQPSALLPPDMVAASRAPHPYPTFCSIPAIPQVPPAEHYKAAVTETRLAGAELVQETSAPNWTLEQSEAFAAGAKQEATPPPAVTTDTDTEAFIREMKRRATPPPRPRR